MLSFVFISLVNSHGILHILLTRPDVRIVVSLVVVELSILELYRIGANLVQERSDVTYHNHCMSV